MTRWGFRFKSYDLKQGSQTRDPWAICGPRGHFGNFWDRTIWNMSRHCQLDGVCAAHLEHMSLVLKTVRTTGIWNT